MVQIGSHRKHDLAFITEMCSGILGSFCKVILNID